MSLTHLTAGAFVAGLVALAGALFLLQRLRVRHRDVSVPTTMFWHEAVEEARARTLVRRFRHPWAYALAVVIATLLWAVVAGPRAEATRGRHHVLLLDGSAAMLEGDRFARAVDALILARAARPAARTTVLFCGATERTLLAPGESAVLLRPRLRGVAPEPSPPSIERTVRSIAAGDDAAETTVVVFGVAPIRAESLALDPDGMVVARASIGEAGAGESPPGIVAFGASEAASGDWTSVDLLVVVEGAAADEVRLDGDPLDTLERTATADGRVRLIVRDVAARGEVVTASVGELGASLALPDRTPIRVAIDDGLAPLFAPVLEADRAVVIVPTEAEADVVITSAERTSAAGDLDGLATDHAGDESTRLTLVPDGASEDTIVVREPGDGTPDQSADVLGLTAIDADALATRAGRPIGVTVVPAATHGLVIERRLFDPAAELVTSHAFPTFVARVVRWLADRAPLRADVAVGRPLVDVDRLTDPLGRTLDAAGLDVVPLRPGLHRDEWGRPIAVSLLDGERPVERDPLAVAPATTRAWGGDLGTWLLLVAFALLGVEWWLHRTGRMP